MTRTNQPIHPNHSTPSTHVPLVEPGRASCAAGPSLRSWGRAFTAAAALLLASPIVACDGDGDEHGDGHGDSTPAIAGTYVDDFGGEHTISAATWIQSSEYGVGVFHVVEVDNAGSVLFAHNADDNEFNPGLYSRFDWFAGDELYFCQTAYDAASLQAAKETPRADEADLATGCAGFPWSKLTPK